MACKIRLEVLETRQRGWDGDSTWLSKEMINKGRRWYSLCDILGTCGILEGIERMKKMTSEWEREGRGEPPLIYSFKFQGLCSREQDWFSRSHHPISFTDFHPTPPWPVTERVHLSTTEYNLETRVPSFFLSFALHHMNLMLYYLTECTELRKYLTGKVSQVVQ